jgi:hypothetical protein
MIVSLALGLALAAPQAPPQIQKATHAVEWTDAAGDVESINTSDGKEPGFDVVKLAISSDGTAITFSATIKSPAKPKFASDVVQVYFDTDRNPKTGVTTFWSKKPGFEYRGALDFCIEYDNGGSACQGSFGGAKIKGYYGAMELGRFAKDPVNPETVVSALDAPKVPVKGMVVSASLSYKDLGVKPGQVIRILARESCGGFDEKADFPEVLLTLK